MADDDKNILQLIENTYLPFLKKLLSHLDKKKEVHPRRNNLKYVYDTFSEADSKEKIKVFHACKDMLDKWHTCYTNRRKTGKKNTNDSEDSQPESILSSKADTQQGPAPKQNNSVTKESSANVQDSNDVESSNSCTILSTPTENNTSFGNVKIKQEKEASFSRTVTSKPVTPTVPSKPVTPTILSKPVTPTVLSKPVTPTLPPKIATPPVPVVTVPESNGPKEITFVCASCQFRTTVEADFVKHARTDHRTDLSLWCKRCGRCFSNAGVLVSHIKENNCEKEEMVYRCGVKECTFETPSGQTFVHHLRHCHKGSPFIYCVHCQKIFTLPHCLILHMQNDCPFKDKNRRSGSSTASTTLPVATASQPAASIPVAPRPATTVVAPRPSATVAPQPKPTLPPPPAKTVSLPTPSSARHFSSKRGRPRGRRSVLRVMSDSSDSEDPDDPSWRPENAAGDQPLRRSARWAKKVSVAKDPDVQDFESVPKSVPEVPGKTFFYCPCCDFSALFKSLLLDHYFSDHKEQKKKQCLVCRVKFETKQSFLDHFEIHEKEKENGIIPGSAVGDENGNDPPSEDMEFEPEVESSKVVDTPKNNEIVETAKGDGVVTIPYQSAVNTKQSKDSKIKSFEDLKSEEDIKKMKTETKLQHFFKCVVVNCSFTTDDKGFYQKHITDHKVDKLHCMYCLEEYSDPQILTTHLLNAHGKRCHQCGLCFYRALSKAHVQIHVRNTHASKKCPVYRSSKHLSSDYVASNEEDTTDLTTTWPYVCAVGHCSFQTYDPKEFKKHNETTHRSVSVFLCHYCKGDFISFKRLLNHYHLHGINNFQCVYCIHGSETKDEILLHLCNNHADKSFKVHVRTNESSGGKNSSNDIEPESPPESNEPEQPMEEYTNQPFTYPVEVPSLEQEMFCRLGLCNELLDTFQAYLKHMVTSHKALNYICPYCYFTADHGSELQRHMLCHGPSLYACIHKNCTEYFSNEEDAIHHMSSSHKLVNGKPKILRQSGEVVSLGVIKEDELLLGTTTNLNSTVFVCPFCSFKCLEAKLLKNHVYQELLYRRFQCNLCRVRCYSRSNTVDHFHQLHFHHNVKCTTERNNSLECLVKHLLSARVQAKIAQWLKNEKNRVRSGFPPCTCRNCQQHLSTMAELHCHESSCISQGYQPYICNSCGEKSSDLFRMKCHTAKDHTGNSIMFSSFPNKLLEEQNNRKLQENRLAFLRELVLSIIGENQLKDVEFVPKHYKCGYCNFTDSFRCNLQKHCKGCHKEKEVSIVKVTTGPKVLSKSTDSSADESSRDGSESMDSSKEYFQCVYCTKKMISLANLDKHIEVNHPDTFAGNTVHPYFYCPNPDGSYSEDETELYDCAYCSVSQENLYHLRRHANNLHSDVTFQVRGHKTKDDIIICRYCECRVVTRELLSKHTKFSHPGKPVKAVNDVCGNLGVATKRKADTLLNSAKRSKLAVEIYQCSYCLQQVNTHEELTSHSETAHPLMAVKFSKVAKEIDNTNNNDSDFMHCDFCSFIGEKDTLARHVKQKHQHCVSCGHCDSNFESTEALTIHTKTQHPSLVVKAVNCLEKFNESNVSEPVKAKVEPIDFMDVIVNITDEISSVNAKLPLMHLAKVVPLFPRVLLKDVTKK